jgi:hypothetical protein
MDRWIDGYIEKRKDTEKKWIDGQMDRWMDGGIGRWMDRYI